MAGQSVRREFLSVILGIGVLLGIVAIVYADRVILHRVTKLSGEISEIAEIDDLAARVDTDGGNDEISFLSMRINEITRAPWVHASSPVTRYLTRTIHLCA